MGRGFGPRQLAIIAFLRRRPDKTVPELAAQIYHGDMSRIDRLTRSQKQQTAEAVRTLAEAKMIKKWSYRTDKGYEVWQLTPIALMPRDPRRAKKLKGAPFRPGVIDGGRG